MPAFVAELPPAFPFPLFFCLPHKCRAVLRFWTLLPCALHIRTLIRTHSFEYLLCAGYSHAYSSGLALLFRPYNWISTSCPFLRQLKAASNPGLYDHSCKIPNQALYLRSSSSFSFSLASHGQAGCSWSLVLTALPWDGLLITPVSRTSCLSICLQPFHLMDWYNKTSCSIFCIISTRHQGSKDG